MLGAKNRLYFGMTVSFKIEMPNKQTLPNAREQKLLEALRDAPELMERFESIIALTEAKVEGRIRTADEVETLLIEQTRKLGRETIETWAGKVEESVADEAALRSPTLRQREKKR